MQKKLICHCCKTIGYCHFSNYMLNCIYKPKGEIIMIGLGKWACNVNTMFFSGEVKINVFDNNGEYGFDLDIPGIDIPDIEIKSVEEDDDSIVAIAGTSLLPGKDIELNITFDGDEFDGFLKIPVIGKVKFKDGHRIEE